MLFDCRLPRRSTWVRYAPLSPYFGRLPSRPDQDTKRPPFSLRCTVRTATWFFDSIKRQLQPSAAQRRTPPAQRRIVRRPLHPQRGYPKTPDPISPRQVHSPRHRQRPEDSVNHPILYTSCRLNRNRSKPRSRLGTSYAELLRERNSRTGKRQMGPALGINRYSTMGERNTQLLYVPSPSRFPAAIKDSTNIALAPLI